MYYLRVKYFVHGRIRTYDLELNRLSEIAVTILKSYRIYLFETDALPIELYDSKVNRTRIRT